MAWSNVRPPGARFTMPFAASRYRKHHRNADALCPPPRPEYGRSVVGVERADLQARRAGERGERRPIEALRLMRDLRDEIDAFERQQVARALTAGGSVASVARALGVTRQSAHRRYRDLLAPSADDGRPRPTPELRLAVEYARERGPRPWPRRQSAASICSSESCVQAIIPRSWRSITSASNIDGARSAVRRLSAANRRGDVKQVLCASGPGRAARWTRADRGRARPAGSAPRSHRRSERNSSRARCDAGRGDRGARPAPGLGRGQRLQTSDRPTQGP